MTSKTEWLVGLKEGDPVVVQTSHPDSKGWLTEVARFTATQLVTQDGARFRRSNGNGIDRRDWYGSWIEEPTAEARAAIRHHFLVNAMKRIVWKELPLATLEAVVELAAKAGKA